MFAVPGWKIAVPLKTQTKPVESNAGVDTDALTKSSKKRKRGAEGEQNGAGATEQNGELVETERQKKRRAKEERARAKKAVQGEESPVKTKGESKSVKGPKKHDEKDSQDGGQAQAAEGDEQSTSKKRRERRKRQKEQARENGTDSKQDNDEDDEDADEHEPEATTTKAVAKKETKSISDATAPPKLTPLQSAMRQKLISSRFRYLNETLYTTPSASSAELFKNNPTFFTEYHEGFARQVEGWPENPVDGFVNLVLSRASISDKGYVPGKVKGANKTRLATASTSDLGSMGGKEPLPRDFKTRVSTIADLGCGSGSFAQQLASFGTALHLKVHSFDLAAPNEHVTVADIRSLPLPDSSVDVTVFSLALMGTNWIEFIEEAWRVLRWKGECWVADVNSRFAGMPTARGRVVEHSVGARVKGKKGKGVKPANQPEEDEQEEVTIDQEGAPAKQVSSTDVSAFVDVLRRRGFALIGEPDVSNRMFARMRFTKSLPPSRGKNKAREKERKPAYGGQGLGKLKFIDKAGAEDDISVDDERKVLKPCVYKTR